MRTGLVHDYTRRGGVVSTEIMLPDGTSAERNALWNAAESAEKRKDGRTGREWIIALPAELDDGTRQELASAFGIELATRYGVAVDLAIHLPDREGDNRNHHAHVMTTTRQVSRDATGLLVMGEKSTIELSDTKRRGMGLGSGADEVVAIRQLWERMANRALQNAGSDARIDSRSLKAQGLDREATTHLGPVASDMERREKASDRGDGNRQVVANNALREQISAQILDLNTFRAARQAEPVEPARKTRLAPVRLPDNPLPVYARNPRKMATLDDISMRGAGLFGPLKAAAEKDQVNESAVDLLRPEVKAAWNPRRVPGIDAPASSDTSKPIERLRLNARPAIKALFAEWRQERGTEKHVAAEAPANIEPPQRLEPPRLSGSAAIRTRIAEWKQEHGIKDDDPVPGGVRERMSAIRDRVHAQMNGKLPLPEVQAVPQPKAAPMVPALKSAEPVISAARLELDALKASVVPIESIVAADPHVIEAQKEYNRIKADVDQAKRWVTEIPVKEAEWRSEHPWRATLHDKGLKKSSELEHCEQSLKSAFFKVKHGDDWLSQEQQNVDKAKNSAMKNAYAERSASPVMQRIEQLKAVVMAEETASTPTTDAGHARAKIVRDKPAYRPQRDHSPNRDHGEPDMDF